MKTLSKLVWSSKTLQMALEASRRVGVRFAGKVVLVTGSSSGIGRAVAVRFAAEGAKVVITGRSAEKVDETRKMCVAVGARPADLLPTCGDLMDDAFLEVLVDSVIETFGHLNVLINNAGTLEVDTSGRTGWDQSPETMDRSFRSNFRSVLLLTQKAFPHLAQTRGDIVNISTFLSSGPIGVMSMPYYAVPKAALDQMSRSMAHEFMMRGGVRLNTVNPGLVSTSFFASLPGVGDESARKMEKYVQSNREYIPLGRVATADDVAHTVLFLADRKQSECIVGQSIVLDGGSRLCCSIDMSDYKEKM